MNYPHPFAPARTALIVAVLLMSAHPAFAQISATAETLLGNVNSWMLGIGGVIVTCALMFVGFRMVFQAAEWKDVAPVFWGGVLIGSAAAVGPQLIG